MKRLISVMIMLLCLVGFVYGEEPADVTIVLNEEVMVLETPPYIINGRTLVPVRFLFEPLGLEVNWDADNFIASGTRDNLDIQLPIGSTEALVNGQTVILDSAAVIMHSRTYVPLRFVAESTGAVVGWDQTTSTITITGGLTTELQEKKPDELLLSIYEDTHDFNGPNYLAIRSEYHKFIDQMYAIKDHYISLNDTLKTELMTLADTLNIVYDAETSLFDLMLTFNQQMLPIHEADTEKLHVVSEDGYYTHHYDFGYYYGYYEDYQAVGYKYSYNTFDGGYILTLVPYTDDHRNGVGYKLIFNDDQTLRYKAYFTAQDDVLVDIEYTHYASGIEAFDYAGVDGDVILRVDSDGTLFIPPTDKAGVSLILNDGVGFSRFADGVEYVGYFEDWDRLGVGLYFASEDDNNIDNNLVDLRVNEILETIITDDLSQEEQIKIIHDYLITHIIYDPNENELGEYQASSHTAYGALINGVAVCDGYSEAFKFLLDKSGINNVLIFGEGEEAGPPFSQEINHAWNLVEIDGVFYHYDLTWNDDDVNERAVYTYYKKDDNYFDDTHWWEPSRYSMYLD